MKKIVGKEQGTKSFCVQKHNATKIESNNSKFCKLFIKMVTPSVSKTDKKLHEILAGKETILANMDLFNPRCILRIVYSVKEFHYLWNKLFWIRSITAPTWQVRILLSHNYISKH